MSSHDECKGCSLYAKDECNKNCLQFKRLKRAEYVEQHTNINRKELLNYLHGLTRFNEFDFDLGYNEAIRAIIDHIEEPNESEKDEEKEEDIVPKHFCKDCVHASLRVDNGLPCYPCYFTKDRPNFKPNEDYIRELYSEK